MFSQSGIYRVRDKVIHRERLGEIRARGLPDARLVVKVDLSSLYDSTVLVTGGQVHAVAVDSKRLPGHGQVRLEQSLVDRPELAHGKRAEIYRPDHSIWATINNQRGQRGSEL